MSWSADQYVKFEAERNRPIHDLLARVSTDPVGRAADIGCGPGNSTEIMMARFPDARALAMDSSADMIAAAQKRLPEVDVTIVDIATWEAKRPFDLILANAAIQWVPDHDALLPRLMRKLSPGGSLAVQVPDNLGEPSHRLMRHVAGDPRWAARLAPALATWDNRQNADSYYRILLPIASSVDLWRTTYFHRLANVEAIVEWVRGTSLRPFLALLDAGERADFEARYLQLIAGAYPELPDGTVLLPFPRLFFVAVR